MKYYGSKIWKVGYGYPGDEETPWMRDEIYIVGHDPSYVLEVFEEAVRPGGMKEVEYMKAVGSVMMEELPKIVTGAAPGLKIEGVVRGAGDE